MPTTDLPRWLTGISAKRPETVLLLHAMILTGLRRGRVSAEDTHHIAVTHPNVRGAAAKLLPGCGFRRGQEIAGQTRKSHGHSLHEWRLDDYGRARRVLDAMRGAVLALPQDNGQLDLALRAGDNVKDEPRLQEEAGQ